MDVKIGCSLLTPFPPQRLRRRVIVIVVVVGVLVEGSFRSQTSDNMDR